MKMIKTFEIFYRKTLISLVAICLLLHSVHSKAVKNDPKLIKPIIGDTSASFNSLKSSYGDKNFPKEFADRGDSQPKYESITKSKMENDGFNVSPKLPSQPSQPSLESPVFAKGGNINRELENTSHYETPVTMAKNRNNSGQREGNFEIPTFIHKNEKSVEKATSERRSSMKLSDPNIHSPPEFSMQNSMKKDIQSLISQFDNAKDKQEKVSILQNGKSRLNQEAIQLSDQIQDELKELLFSKEVAIKAHNILSAFNQKMNKEKKSKLKLADSIQIKNILKEKVHRELQGFRTSPEEYKELENVNPQDIVNIMENIKLKLGQ